MCISNKPIDQQPKPVLIELLNVCRARDAYALCAHNFDHLLLELLEGRHVALVSLDGLLGSAIDNGLSERSMRVQAVRD